MTTEVRSFGCRLNMAEGGAIAARAAAEGLADTVVINSCAVTGEAVRQARQAVRRARREQPGARIVVTGCAAQIEPDGFAAMPEVDLVLGNALKAAPGALGSPERVRLGEWTTRPAPLPVAPSQVRAYLEVQNGCDHSCTFCVIPLGRGPSRSAAGGDIVESARRLVRQGAREVVLTGVDVTSYGADLPGRPSLGRLVRRILRLVPELPRLRLSSVDAAEIDPDLLRAFAEEERLQPHLHLSLQSGDDLILKRMKRRHLRADAVRLAAEVRAARTDTAFGADLIAGFPTETEAMAANTVGLIEALGLSYVHVFPFSPRPGTPAARMPQLPREVVKARAARLRQAGRAALARHLEGQAGRLVPALVESPGLARAPDFTEISLGPSYPVGAILPVRTAGHDGRRARGAVWPDSVGPATSAP